MDGIAKSPPSTEVIQVSHQDPVVLNTYEGIDIDVARFFDVDVLNMHSEDKRKLTDIQSWVEGSTGDKLLFLRSLRLKFGEGQEGSINQAWNWLRLNTHIKELRKRQMGFER